MKKIISQIIAVLTMVIIVAIAIKSCQQRAVNEDAKVANEKCYEACAAEDKAFVRIQGVGHGLSWCLEPEKYQSAMTEFLGKTLGIKQSQ